MTPQFDLFNTPLETGSTLIEASAGTGKTYTIAGLVLRLILEQGLSVREILVVTFTEAATEELRGRIRQLLAEALQSFRSGETENPFLKTVLRRHNSETVEMQARLDQALCGFDEAPIHTIHGFCQRILKDHAFESGLLFDLELAPDNSQLQQEVSDDYWRMKFYSAPVLRVNFALKLKLSPEELRGWLDRILRHPGLKLLFRQGLPEFEEAATGLEQAFEQAREMWNREKETIRRFFGSGVLWGNAPYNNDGAMSELYEMLELCFSSEFPAAECYDAFEAFCSSSLSKKINRRRKGHSAPSHPFFEMCERICRLEKDYEQALLRDFIQFAQKELPRRKEERKVQWFDDLLSRTLSALKGPGDGDLAAALRQKYRAALIDEFQDTDPVQYRIFEAIYSGEDQWLYLIGDPKQAIYGFRGADVFTYLEACRKVKQRFTLGQNWRSESGLVQAVNAFFQDHCNPFVFGEISFAPVEARGKADQEKLTINGERKAPAEIWFWESQGGTLSKEKTCQVLPEVVAGEISRLLRENTRIGERKLSPQDIAVLAPENQQARLMQQALNALSVPSVLYTTSSVFASGEAEELRRVLFSMAEPGNERLLRGALAGEMLGAEAAHIESLSKDESGWARWLLKFQDYLGLWNEHGFLQMFRRFLQQEQVRMRLLRLKEGERKLTNILHLGELLHQASIESRLGVSGLLKWFNAQISAGKESVEEEQLRLESDETAVRIITIHRSKGLEFPVVFCPFLNRVAGSNKRGGIFFHDEDGQLVCDFGSERAELHQQGAFAEALAENVRLFYVAVTRAKHRLYLVCGKFKEGHATAPGWLFHRPQDLPNQEWRQAHARYFNELSNENLKQALETMAKGCGDSDGGPVLSISSLPDAGEAQPFLRGESEMVLDARQFTGRIPSDWRIASFSFLSSGRHDEAPDRDRELRIEKEPQPASGMFAFPRGSKAGACLHELLEETDFTAADGDLHRPVVERALRSHGFDPTFSESLIGMVQQVCLLPLRNQAEEFMLSTLKSGEWLKELEFYFPLRNFSPRELKACLEEAGFPGQLDHFPSGARLWLDPMNGFLKGYIDLVFRSGGRFYFLDWKSNWLGNRIEDYHQKALAEVMRKRCYELQSLLYSVALHQYLELRLPDYRYDQHFGGAFYIFLRGLDAARPEFGVHASRPSLELIRRMSGLFFSCSR